MVAHQRPGHPSPKKMPSPSLSPSPCCLLVLALLLALPAAPLSAQEVLPPPADGKGRMLLEIIDTLERDIERLSHSRRDLARRKDDLERKLASLQEKSSRLARDIETSREQIVKILRAMARLREPDDLLLFFSSFKYHDLHVYRRNIRHIAANLASRLSRLVQERKEMDRQRSEAGEELAEMNTQRQELADQIASLEATAKRTHLELSERTGKIAAIENLFMTSGADSPLEGDAGEPRTPFEGKPLPADLSGLNEKHELPLPISPGRLVKNFEEPAEPPLGTEKMIRGWILVPFTGGKKKGTSDVAFVRAPHPGAVVFVGEVPGFGLTIVLDHASRFHTVYSNLNKVHVVKGDIVDTEKTIATVKSLNAGKELPYLYFELRHRRMAVDPKPWFRLRPIEDAER